MPVQPTFPGVYIEEIPGGVRTIAGVPTSVTAFVGSALRGPVNQPVVINGYGDFERTFGGLALSSSMSFAVRDYFQNGGGQAVIVRVFRRDAFDTGDSKAPVTTALSALRSAIDALAAGSTFRSRVGPVLDAAVTSSTDATRAAVTTVVDAGRTAATPTNATKTSVLTAVDAAAARVLAGGVSRAVLRLPPTATPLVLVAASPGAWGNALRVRVDHAIHSGAPERFGATATDLFNLTVRDMATGVTEVFQNVTVIAGTRQLGRVLENESSLVRVLGDPPAARPPESDAGLTPGELTRPPFALDTTGNDPRTVGVATADRASDGLPLDDNTLTRGNGLAERKEGLYALERTDIFNLLCIPPPTLDGTLSEDVLDDAVKYCRDRRAMMIVDPPADWRDKNAARDGFTRTTSTQVAARSPNAAVYFPRIVQANPLRDGQLEPFAPCGAVAGVIARTDASRGVFKAPAGLDASLNGVRQLAVSLTDAENGELNPLGINCLRALPAAGRVIWGARTLVGDDRLASEWKYVPVRRLALHIEESLYRGTQWVVFEGNDEPLWSQIRLNVGAFMNTLFRQGAFQGRTPREAYFVKCDAETTTQNDINLGVVNIVVGFAPLKPAEFVIIKLQQIAGQIAV